MQEYVIEYSDHGLLIRAVGGSVVLLFGIHVVVLRFLADGAMVSVAGVGVVLPLAYFFVRKRKIRRTGIVLIGYGRMVFNVFNRLTVIGIHEVACCQISHCHGTALTLVLKNGKKFSMSANRMFCDSSKLQHACDGIEKALQKFHTGD